MEKVKHRLIFIGAILILTLGFGSIGKTIIIKYTGKKVIAIVSEIPSSCDRYNHIDVLLDGVDYEVNISRIDCKEGVYKVGQSVTLLKNKNYKELVWPESQPEIVPLLILAVFILAYVSMKGRLKKNK